MFVIFWKRSHVEQRIEKNYTGSVNNLGVNIKFRITPRDCATCDEFMQKISNEIAVDVSYIKTDF